jgi:hypothetical protein
MGGDIMSNPFIPSDDPPDNDTMWIETDQNTVYVVNENDTIAMFDYVNNNKESYYKALRFALLIVNSDAVIKLVDKLYDDWCVAENIIDQLNNLCNVKVLPWQGDPRPRKES